jgi:hypothetical protein
MENKEKKISIDPNLVLPAPQLRRCGADNLNIRPVLINPAPIPSNNINNANNININNTMNQNNIYTNNISNNMNQNININNNINNISQNNNASTSTTSYMYSNNPNWKNFY